MKKKKPIDTSSLKLQSKFPALISYFYSHFNLVIVLSLLLIISFNFSHIKQTFRLQPTRQKVYQDNINDKGDKLRQDAKLVEGNFNFDANGVVLHPGQNFSITYRFDKEPDDEVYIALWFYVVPGVSNQIQVIRPDEHFFSDQNLNLQGSPEINLTEQLRGFSWFILKLSATLDANAPDKPVLVYDGIKLSLNSPILIPPLSELCFLFIIPLGIFLALSFYQRLSTYALPVAISVLFILLLKFNVIGDKFVSVKQLAYFSTGLAIFSYWRFAKGSSINSLINFLVLFIIVTGLDYRWASFTQVINKPLSPDAITYLAITKNMKGLFDTDFREPLFLWAVKIFFFLFGSSEINLRLMTLFASLITIWLTYIFATRVTHSTLVGLLAALLIAHSDGYIYQNLRGLRLEIYMLTIIPFIYVLLMRHKPIDLKYALLVGFLAGLNQLNNLSALSFCVLLILYFAVRQKWRLWLIPVPIIMALVITTPHLIHNKRQFGDAFYSSNIHARYYRNQEFKGKPGFPTEEEVRRNGYTGSHITTFEYFFKLHSLSEVIQRNFQGLKLLYFSEESLKNILTGHFFYFFYIIGLIIMLFYSIDFIICFLLLNITSYFFVGTTSIFFDLRLTMHVSFMIVTLTALGLVKAGEFFIPKLKPERRTNI